MKSNLHVVANLPDQVTVKSSRLCVAVAAALLIAAWLVIAPLTAEAATPAELARGADSADEALDEQPVDDIDDVSQFLQPEEIHSSETPVSWLPDLRVLAGAPETAVDLGNLSKKLCAENYFGQGVKPSDLQWEVLQNTKSSVADLKIVGPRLRVLWNENATGKTKIVLKANVKSDEELKAYASFNAESWAPDYGKLLLTVLGGLGLFLLGMKNMTSGLTAIAGAKLRKMISFFTDNRFAAVGVGIVTTTLMQSSSATSVMALGFVDSGLMTLTQAINVIIGTNIGTTTTGWLLTFKIGAFGLPILGFSALALVFSKTESVKHWATFALGFGMIFFGLEVLKSGLSPLSDLPQFGAFIQTIQANSLLNVGKGILVGALATMVVQSSAVTLAIVITLATLGTIDLSSAIAIVLGSNIGTTITAVLASAGTGPNARRAAVFHVVFNVLGVLWVWPVFFIFLLPTIHSLGNMFGLQGDVSKIALTHTVFNLVNTIVFLPFTNKIATVLNKVVKDSGDDAKKETATDLHKWLNSNATIGLSNSRLVVQRMFLSCRQLVVNLSELQVGNFEDEEKIRHNFGVEEELDKVQDETIEFVTSMTRKADSSDLVTSAREQIRLAQELETISDYLTGVLKSNLKLKKDELAIPEAIKVNMQENLDSIVDTLDRFATQFDKHAHQHLAEPMKAQRDLAVESIKRTRNAFQQEMFEKQYAPAVIAAVDYQLNAARRMYEHLLNIAEAMEGPGKTPRVKAPAFGKVISRN